MIKVILIESIVIVLLGIFLFWVITTLRKLKKEITELEIKNQKLTQDIENYAEIRNETIENQKKYHTNNNVDNFNNTIDFLQNINGS